MTEKETIDMAKAKFMTASSIWKNLKRNLTHTQIVLYMNALDNADTLGIISEQDWAEVRGVTDEDVQTLIDLEYIYEIKQKRSVAYVIADWWKHNTLPRPDLRKTSLNEVLDMLYIDGRVYNLTGEGERAADWITKTRESDEKPTKTAKSPKSEKPSEPQPNPILEEVMALWNASYPDKTIKHKPGTKIYDQLLSSIIYAGVDDAKAAAARSGCEWACKPWFNFDTIFSDPDKILRLKNGLYDELFGDEKQIQEQKLREQQKSTKPMSDDDKLAALGL